jgi:hypothetical protein
MSAQLTTYGKIMTFDELIRYKALHLKYITANSGLMDMVAADELSHNIPMKNVCALITQELFDDLTNTCSLLDISKRSFIEAALIDALGRAEEIVEKENVYERFTKDE